MNKELALQYANEIEEIVSKEHFTIDPYYDNGDLIIASEIYWGDWKHQHLRFDWLLEKFANEHNLNFKQTGYLIEDSDCDCYSAYHQTRLSSK